MSRKKKPHVEPEPKPATPGPLRQRAFEGLKGLRDSLEAEAPKPAVASKATASKPAPRKEPHEVWRPDLDKELFDVAMSGVVPLREGKSGARVPPPRSETKGHDARLRRAFAEGDGGKIEVRWTDDGRCEAARRGRSFALEALGRFALPQEQLDLHGLDPTEARARVEEFVRTRRERGVRTVCIVHGAGRHSPDGTSVLRDAVVRTLSEPPGSREVDAFCTAEKKHGGHGALLVALRAESPKARR